MYMRHPLLSIGHYLAAKGSTSSYGQVALIVSPPETFESSVTIGFQLSSKMRPEDAVPELTVYVFSDHQLLSKTVEQSTDGFVGDEICADAGEVVVAFEAVWGLYSSPFFALDNVTVRHYGPPCPHGKMCLV